MSKSKRSIRAYNKKYYEEHQDERRQTALRRYYGMTAEQYARFVTRKRELRAEKNLLEDLHREKLAQMRLQEAQLRGISETEGLL